jgi:hypothetical protein
MAAFTSGFTSMVTLLLYRQTVCSSNENHGSTNRTICGRRSHSMRSMSGRAIVGGTLNQYSAMTEAAARVGGTNNLGGTIPKLRFRCFVNEQKRRILICP